MYQVIIVEDDPMVASINRQYLLANPMFQVVGEFRNGKEALDYLEKQSVDLAVIDYYMPFMDGKEFMTICKERKIYLDIIMITAANSVRELNDILHLGVVDYLVKPFTYERFQQAIQKYMEYRKVLKQDRNRTLNQNEIDRIMAPKPAPASTQMLEKGLQPQTLDIIKQFLAQHPGVYMSSNEVAASVNLSRITVRRYMNYLLENGEIISQVDYTTGGRPSIKYRKN
jgi:CitB family two-component system response regulator MalR/two-component system response regulator DctR